MFQVLLIFLLGLSLRFISIYPSNTVIGFDQARDLFDASGIFLNSDLKIIGPTAGNNPNLHHGVAYLYYLIPPLLLFNGNPTFVALYSSLFNAFTIITLFFLAKSIFKDKKVALITAFLAATSFHFIQFAGWLSNPSPTLFTVPLFFLGLWKYQEGKNKGLYLASFFLGLSIQFELFFIYLIPIALITFILLKIKLPTLKAASISLLLFLISVSTMLATEIKFHFAGVEAIFSAGNSVGGTKPNFVFVLDQFISKFFNTFSYNLWPQNLKAGPLLAALSICSLIFYALKAKDKKPFIFILIYLLSPATMLLLGYHDAPWFLVGLPPVICLSAAFLISKLKNPFIVVVLLFILINSFQKIRETNGQGQILLGPDKSSVLTSQIAAIDYTYKEANKNPFTINTLTNPLYINAIWAYNYHWYGLEKYKYLPTFSGNDQLPPYNTLKKSDLSENYLFLLIDKTFRIPFYHTESLVNWANERSTLLEEKDFNGILVQKRQLFDKNKL